MYPPGSAFVDIIPSGVEYCKGESEEEPEKTVKGQPLRCGCPGKCYSAVISNCSWVTAMLLKYRFMVYLPGVVGMVGTFSAQ